MGPRSIKNICQYIYIYIYIYNYHLDGEIGTSYRNHVITIRPHPPKVAPAYKTLVFSTTGSGLERGGGM